VGYTKDSTDAGNEGPRPIQSRPSWTERSRPGKEESGRHTLNGRPSRLQQHKQGLLVERLKELGVEADLIRWTRSFMTNRKVKLVLNGGSGGVQERLRQTKAAGWTDRPDVCQLPEGGDGLREFSGDERERAVVARGRQARHGRRGDRTAETGQPRGAGSHGFIPHNQPGSISQRVR